MSGKTTVPVSALRWGGGCLVCLLWFAPLLAGCSRETTPGRPREQVTAGHVPDDPSESKDGESAGPRDTGKSSEEAPASQAGTAAIPAADARLCEACRHGRLSEAGEALQEGANVNARDEDGAAAIMLAAYDGHAEIVRLLIHRGAEVNAVDGSGRTALMYAASGPDKETVQLLLVHGAKVDMRDREEMYTALMFAAAEGHVENVRLLLAHGSNPALVDSDGETAADFAARNGHAKVVELLK